MIPLHLIINNENCCVARLFVFCSIYSNVFVFTPSLTISRGKIVFFLQIAQSGWSILVDTANVEEVLVVLLLVLLVLEIPHNKEIPQQYLPFRLRLGA